MRCTIIVRAARPCCPARRARSPARAASAEARRVLAVAEWTITSGGSSFLIFASRSDFSFCLDVELVRHAIELEELLRGGQPARALRVRRDGRLTCGDRAFHVVVLDRARRSDRNRPSPCPCSPRGEAEHPHAMSCASSLTSTPRSSARAFSRARDRRRACCTGLPCTRRNSGRRAPATSATSRNTSSSVRPLRSSSCAASSRAERPRHPAPHVGRDDARMQRVAVHAFACAAARELLHEEHVAAACSRRTRESPRPSSSARAARSNRCPSRGNAPCSRRPRCAREPLCEAAARGCVTSKKWPRWFVPNVISKPCFVVPRKPARPAFAISKSMGSPLDRAASSRTRAPIEIARDRAARTPPSLSSRP